MNLHILTPAAVLVLWTLVMLVWVAATRLPALKKLGVDMRTVVGSRGQNLEGVVPDPVNWKSHNYSHLHEQPTLFYAVVAIIAIAGGTNQLSIALAWAYVILRIIHSIIQATVNKISLRFPIFALSSVILLVLAIKALCVTL